MNELAIIKPARTIEELGKAYEDARQKGNLLSPLVAVNDIPALHKVALHAVLIDPTIPDKETSGPEVYSDMRFCRHGEVALKGVALDKICRAANTKTLWSKRVDDGTQPYYWEMEVALAVRELDGGFSHEIRKACIDLREGGPDLFKPEWKVENGKNVKTGKMIRIDDSALAEKRKNGFAICESRAKNRCTRALFSLKSKYTVAELAKPFWVPVLVQDLDPNNPDEKLLLLEQMREASAALYGAPLQNALPQGAIPGQVLGVTPIEMKPAMKAIEGPDPWEAEEPKGTRLPLTQAQLESVQDPMRTKYLLAIQEHAMAVMGKMGGVAGAKRLIELVGPVDLLFDPLESLAEVGRSVKASANGGAACG